MKWIFNRALRLTDESRWCVLSLRFLLSTVPPHQNTPLFTPIIIYDGDFGGGFGERKFVCPIFFVNRVCRYLAMRLER